MKKNYITPEMQTVSVCLTTMIANSNAVDVQGLDVEPPSFGGVDVDGGIDPAARSITDQFFCI